MRTDRGKCAETALQLDKEDDREPPLSTDSLETDASTWKLLHQKSKGKAKQDKPKKKQHQRKWHHNSVAKAKGRRVRPRQEVMLMLAISEVAPEEATSSRLISPFKLPQLVVPPSSLG